MVSYYDKGASYSSFTETIVEDHKAFTRKRIAITSAAGETFITYFQKHLRPGEAPDENLVLVFPLLGGSNKLVDYFAEYFVHQGFDAAIVERCRRTGH